MEVQRTGAIDQGSGALHLQMFRCAAALIALKISCFCHESPSISSKLAEPSFFVPSIPNNVLLLDSNYSHLP